MKVMDRHAAQSLGLTRYFTGKPCKHGHIAERRVHGGCTECTRFRESQPEALQKRRIAKRRRYNPALALKRRLADLERRRTIARDSARRRRAADPRIRERDRATAKKWAEQNPDKRRQYAQQPAVREKQREHARRMRLEKPDNVRSAMRRWRERDPEHAKVLARTYSQRRRANKLDSLNTFTKRDWETLAARSKRCHWCKRIFTPTRQKTHDHVIPLHKGGANTLENSCCACAQCNSRKGARLVNPATEQGILL